MRRLARLLSFVALAGLVLAAVGCGPAPCVPVTCAEAGRVCGAFPDGCGQELDCGGCAPDLECNPFGECEKPCVRTTCEALGKDCGRPPDGCRGALQCGTCGGDLICGGGAEPFLCALPPDPCAAGAWAGYAGEFMQAHCAGCHRAYRTLAGTRGERELRAEIATGGMPRGRTLTAAEKAWVLRWIDCGMPE